jgi:hypothetical protein
MRRARWPTLVCLVVAAALYASAAVLDETVIDGARVRVAFLPPWESAAGLLLAAIVGVALAARLATGRRNATRAPYPDVLRPMLTAGVLIVPFLPWLADYFPVLQILSGPLRWVVWLAIAGVTAWAWSVAAKGMEQREDRLDDARPRIGWLRLPRSRTTQTIAIGIATAVIAATAAARLTGTVLYPSGDEPHYLVIAQSLWRDGDFDIENNHDRGDYAEYYQQTLDPHYLTRGSDGKIYSIHPVGLPLLMAPVYAAGGYRGVVVALIVMAAIAAALSWRWVATVTGAPRAATFAWAAIVTSTPFLFNTFTVYPEIAAALAVMIGITTPSPWVLGVVCGALPWLSTKYAPMSAVLLVTGVLRGSGPSSWRLVPPRAVLAAALPYGAMLAAWFAFFYALWGTPMPQAPYGGLVQTTPWNLVFGAPGLLFDQEFGLLPYAPAYALAATGLWALWRGGADQRALAIRVVVVFVALLGTVGAFRIWWGGSASPSRPLSSGLLLLALPIATAFAEAQPGTARRAAQHLLLWIGVGITVQMGFAQEGFLLANGRDGSSALLEWWLPRWETWSLAPSFIYHEAGAAAVQSMVWVIIAAVCATVLRRLTTTRPGAAALAACGVLAAGLFSAAIVIPLLPAHPPQPIANLRARARIPALDSYDRGERPAAIVYDPLRKTAAEELLPRFTLLVVPGLRPEAQPLRVVHNGRFSLPEGRYRIDIQFVDVEHPGPRPLSVQLGRTGPPLATWTVDPASGPWATELALPADVGFVGLRSGRELERAVRAVTITPLAVKDESRRPRLPQVLGSGRYGDTVVLIHDDQTATEPEGFWVQGKRPTRITFATAALVAPTVHIRSEHVANHVTFRAPGWVKVMDLRPGVTELLELPPPSRGVISITVEASDGFVPADRDPNSHDRRLLGIWIEVG